MEATLHQPQVPRWLPNAISVMRVLLVPVWLWLAHEARGVAASDGEVERLPLVGVLVTLMLSDLLDGFLARRFHLATNLGAILDAAADKLAQVATVTFLALFAAPAFTPLPVWLLVVLVTRDVLLGVGFLLVRARHGHVKTEHKWHGKASTALLFVLVLAVCLGLSGPVVPAASAVVLALVVPSTLVYLREGWRQLMAPTPEAR